jgi:hypothetical protein
VKSADPGQRDRTMRSRFYDTDLISAAWARVAPALPAARPRTSNLRANLNAIFYLLRTGSIGLLVVNRVESADTSIVEERTVRSLTRRFCAICKPIEFGHQCLVCHWPKASNYTSLNAIPAFSCLRQYLHALLGDLRGS